jgi:hypothetical protein
VSPLFVLIHIGWLPLGSATIAEQRGGRKFRDWDEDRYLRVAELNAQRVANYMFLCANMDPKKKRPAPPTPYPLPDGRPKEDQVKRPGSFAAMAASMMRKK